MQGKNKKTGIIIIGGGVIGACTALYLTRAGRRVTLVEKGELCSGASLGNACWVAAGYALPTAAPGVLGQGIKWLLDSGSPFYIKPRLSLDLVRWLLAFSAACNHSRMMTGANTLLPLNRLSLEMFEELAQELDFDFHKNGLLHLHMSEETRQKGEKEADIMRGLGMEVISIGRDELVELEPKVQDGVLSGVFYPDHAHLDPAKLVSAVAAQAEKEGATILTHTAVTGFQKDGGRIAQIETIHGTIEPDEVVLAAGAWSSILAKQLGAPILMEPAKGYSITVRKRSAEQGPSRPLAVDDTKVAITPLGDDRFRFSSTLELAGFDPSINKTRLAVNKQSLQEVLPDMEVLDGDEPWAGYRPLTPDGLPYIGRTKRLDNLIFATGHGKLGVTHGPITAKLVAEVLAGDEPSIDLEPMSPDRY